MVPQPNLIHIWHLWKWGIVEETIIVAYTIIGIYQAIHVNFWATFSQKKSVKLCLWLLIKKFTVKIFHVYCIELNVSGK